MEGCIFCRITRGSAPAHYVYRDPEISVILDVNPVEKGHLLVISNDHYESIHDAPPRVAGRVFRAAAALARIYRVHLGAPGVNVLTNSGRAAGQEVFHFHVHVIPRWMGGGWRSLTLRHRLTGEEALEVVDMLSPHLGLLRDYLSGDA